MLEVWGWNRIDPYWTSMNSSTTHILQDYKGLTIYNWSLLSLKMLLFIFFPPPCRDKPADVVSVDELISDRFACTVATSAPADVAGVYWRIVLGTNWVHMLTKHAAWPPSPCTGQVVSLSVGWVHGDGCIWWIRNGSACLYFGILCIREERLQWHARHVMKWDIKMTADDNLHPQTLKKGVKRPSSQDSSSHPPSSSCDLVWLGDGIGAPSWFLLLMDFLHSHLSFDWWGCAARLGLRAQLWSLLTVATVIKYPFIHFPTMYKC